MPRTLRRQQLAGAVCFHVLDRGHDRTLVFADDEDRRAFLGLLARYRDRLGFRLHHYCLMTNHFHLVVWPQSVGDLIDGLHGQFAA